MSEHPSPLAENLPDRVGPVTDFMLDRLDNVALWVIEWMPPQDNEQHHNAIEHLLRLRQTAIWVAQAVDPAYRPQKLDEEVALYEQDAIDDERHRRRLIRDWHRRPQQDAGSAGSAG